MASVKIFGSPASTEVARVLTCLMEKDLDFQLIRMDSYKGDSNVPEFIKLQDPSGQVTYKEGKKTLLESRTICRHVSEKFASQGTNLLGSGTLERASIEQWLQAEEQSFDPPSSDLITHLAFAPLLGLNVDPSVVESCKKKLARLLNIYEEKLDESRFLAGDEFTLADLSHLPNSHYLMKTAIGFEMFEQRRNVSRWWNEISSRKSWKTVAAMQGELPLQDPHHSGDTNATHDDKKKFRT